MRRIPVVLIFLMIYASPAAYSQVIGIKSIPVATGDQFLLFPTQNLGMGGVTIALDDPLSDPFDNPARGMRLEGTQFISSPMFYTISLNNEFSNLGSGGHARTIPLGMLSRNGNSYGGLVVAWQQLSVERPTTQIFFDQSNLIDVVWAPPTSKSDELDNIYAFLTGGFQSADGSVSFGGSLLAAKLNGVEGVRLLYQRGDLVDQDGQTYQFRLGMTAELNSVSTLDAIVVHHRFNMEQVINNTRTEKDETNGVGARIDYTRRMEDGWRLGGQLTGNWQWHPKIPNYDLMQIPRDPGNSSAYNIGVGVAREYNQLTVGLDLIYEPIDSHTWADAASAVPILDASGVATGRFILPGQKTVENFFTFNNRIIRAGVRQEGETVDLQFGVDVHTIRYHLDQVNFERQFERSQNERWSEWTLSAGLALKFTSIEIRYLGRLTMGTGQPGIAFNGWGCPNCFRAGDAALESSFIVAPAGDLTLQEAKVFTSQFSIHVPIGH